ncbi:MAG: hypothetical protein JNK33_04835 [Candidatus Doudnabacteria bacterium]|nr:hypothetical protein [Candidatus Doudnabacteria bacterium]
MGKQTLTLSSKILITALQAGYLVFGLRGRIIDKVYNPGLDVDRRLKRTLYYLYKKGYIAFEDRAGRRLMRLTQQGKLRTLFDNFGVDKARGWDGKWRVVLYDIPQSARAVRFQVLHQLKVLGFAQLQASVYIGPYALNESALQYLRTSGLIKYIRIMLVERVDNDAQLRRTFKLRKYHTSHPGEKCGI